MKTLVSITGKSLIKNGIIWFLFSIARPLPPGMVKNLFYRLGGVRMGKRVFISPYAVIDPVAPDLVTLEDDVFIGWGASIICHQVDQDFMKGLSSRKYSERRVVLRKGCFIGGYSTVRGGVTVGRGAVVGSNSLVCSDVPPNVLVTGVPARVAGVENGCGKST